MSNVIIDKSKIDILANAISAKSGEPVTMTLEEMVEAVDSIETGGGTPTLETVTKTYTPTTSQQTDTITPSSGYDGIGEVDVTVSAVPEATVVDEDSESNYYTDGSQRKWRIRFYEDFIPGGWIDGTHYTKYSTRNAVPSNTSVTPTESAQTIGGANYMMEGAVTVNAIPSSYVGSGITQRSSLDLTANGATVTAPAGYYSSAATKSVASGTEGTPTASKGSVSNHAVTVTPSVTNSAGYISGGTKTGTGVSVSASELVSGNLPITQNGNNIDVANYATVSVSVSGGGSSGMQIGTKTATPSSAAASISFTGLSGEPTSFVVTSDAELATGASPYKTATVVFDGTNVIGQYISNTSNAQVTYDSSGFSKSYSNGTLTITGTNANFQANQYTLVYTYGGSSANLGTADVQVGSGATSITFTGLEDEPDYFSVAFKSNFGTSSGYQRVITVVYDGTSTYGLEMDSSAKYSSQHWSYTYNNGSLVVSSSGTNAGGYFHQPGYYQLTYAVGGDSTLQKKTVTPTSSDQTVTADTAQGYTALSQVKVEGVVCDNLTASNIKSGVTVKIGTSTDDDSVASVTGTYSGGGGASNLVTGTFKGTTTGAAIDVTLNYSGSGYPIALLIYPKGGYVGNSTFSNLSQRYAIGMWSTSKANVDVSPTYTGSSSDDGAFTVLNYRSSTDKITYGQYTSKDSLFNDVVATGSRTSAVKIRSNTKMSVFIASTSYGFAANIEYTYHVIYSS